MLFFGPIRTSHAHLTEEFKCAKQACLQYIIITKSNSEANCRPNKQSIPSSHDLSLSPLSLPELWSWSPTARADCWPRHWLHPHIPPPPVLGHPLPLWAGPPEVHHGPGGHTHLAEQSPWISHQALPHGGTNKSYAVWGLLSCCSMVACLLQIKAIGNVSCKILYQLLSDANLTQCWTKPVCVACQ